MNPIPARWRPVAAELFGIDLRTLALFRVALATLIIGYALNRFPDIGAFLTDWGVLPRSMAITTEGWARISLYFINGEWWFAALLLSITIVCAASLWIGYRTRLMTVCLFVLMGSLITRNPIILIGGDALLMCLLFWAMFLPLGARWAIDAAFATAPPPAANLHVSAASAGLLIQVMSVYFFSAWLKNGPDWWPDLTALYYTMELERYASPLGHGLLGQFPRLMTVLSAYVYFLEWLGPLIAFSPWLRRPLRFLVMLAFMAMHTGFVLFMEIGYFPFVSLTSLTVLLGGWFWDWRARVSEERHPIGPRIYYDRDCAFCLNTCRAFREFLVLPRAHIAPAQNSQRAGALLEANYSWVVIDARDVAHIKWPAFVALLEHSPVFGWLFPLARWSALEKPGNVVYDFVGRHRGRFGSLTEPLFRPRQVRFEVGRRAQYAVTLFVVLVLAWNLSTVNVVPPFYQLLTSRLFRLARIDQIWNMFAPVPSHKDGWVVYPGKLEDGTAVDVLKPGKPLTWDRPAHLSREYPNIAWHTYRWRITDKPFHGHLLYYGKYLCRDWNWKAEPGKRLLTFEMTYIEEYTPPPGGTATLERRVIWRHDCRPQEPDREKDQREEKKRDPMKDDRSRPV